MILFKNAAYSGKTLDLLITENAGENAKMGFSFAEDEFHKNYQNYGSNYGKQGGRIAALAENIAPSAYGAENCTVIDMAGKVLFPSLIDVHVHFRDGPFLHPVAAATLGLKGEALAPLGEMAEAGCTAVSNDGVPLTSTEIVRRVMEYGSDLDMLFVDHCEDPYLARGAHMNEGRLSAKLGVKGQPDIGEALQVGRDIMLSEYLNIPVHICHVSCRKSLDLIRRAKGRGVDITAETCPHYLLLDENAIDNYNTNAKVNPPLRTWNDVLAMREAVKSGLIDCLITDHAPHSAQEKENPLDMVPNGISGLDTALALLWKLVCEGVFTQEDIVRAYTVNPGKRFKVPYNSFAKGNVADFFFFDPAIEWVVNKDNFYSKSANTPFLGQTLQGRVCTHYLGGKKVF